MKNQDTGFSKKTRMSPAARRRLENGKRMTESFETKGFSLDMEEKLIEEALSSYADDDWTKSLRLKSELLEAEVEKHNQESAYRREKRNEKKFLEQKNRDRLNHKVNANKRDDMGMFLSNAQIAISILLLLCILFVNLLPYLYVVGIAIFLIVINIFIRKSQSLKIKHRGFGKIISVCCTLCMTIGIYYCIVIYMLLVSISGSNSSATNLSSDTYSVYISGIDVYGDIDTESRSDVNLIATINPTTGQVLLTTTPRDYYVEISGVSDGQGDKLTHAGNYGIETSIATLEELYDVEIDFYLRVNFTSFINIIDALGGVTVESEIAFTTSENSGLVVEIVEGENYLTGEEALAFVRERYNLDDGDIQRGINQQIMLEAVFYEFISPSTIWNFDKILESVADGVETNMETSQLQQLSRGVLSSILDTNIYSTAASGTADYAYCYSYSSSALSVIIPDQESVDEIKSLMDSVESGEDLPE